MTFQAFFLAAQHRPDCAISLSERGDAFEAVHSSALSNRRGDVSSPLPLCKKKEAHIDLRLKDIAPSADPRMWFGHDPSKWTEFRSRYLAELLSKTELTDSIGDFLARGTVRLSYGAKDKEHNHAIILLEELSRP